MVQGPLELEPPARNILQGAPGTQPQRQVGVQKLTGLLHPVISGNHIAREDERLRLAARFRKAPLLHEQVGPDLHRWVAALGEEGPMMAWMRASSRSMSIGLEK